MPGPPSIVEKAAVADSNGTEHCRYCTVLRLLPVAALSNAYCISCHITA